MAPKAAPATYWGKPKGVAEPTWKAMSESERDAIRSPTGATKAADGKEWPCPKCHVSCWASRKACFKCGTKKPGGPPTEPTRSLKQDKIQGQMDQLTQKLNTLIAQTNKAKAEPAQQPTPQPKGSVLKETQNAFSSACAELAKKAQAIAPPAEAAGEASLGGATAADEGADEPMGMSALAADAPTEKMAELQKQVEGLQWSLASFPAGSAQHITLTDMLSRANAELEAAKPAPTHPQASRALRDAQQKHAQKEAAVRNIQHQAQEAKAKADAELVASVTQFESALANLRAVHAAEQKARELQAAKDLAAAQTALEQARANLARAETAYAVLQPAGQRKRGRGGEEDDADAWGQVLLAAEDEDERLLEIEVKEAELPVLKWSTLDADGHRSVQRSFVIAQALLRRRHLAATFQQMGLSQAQWRSLLGEAWTKWFGDTELVAAAVVPSAVIWALDHVARQALSAKEQPTDESATAQAEGQAAGYDAVKLIRRRPRPQPYA